jgi:tRNA threonylcarbamoyladenosine biosynthesis protein TsaB|tara:strand:- start:408 stop:1076 length:669 start_codon:yes stop_codon:yes gene_type:complete
VRLLALDTATEGCSAACLAGESLVERYQIEPQGHSRLLLTMVESVLAETASQRADLDAVAFDAGPGSFTGIRIGAGVAQGIALGLELPLVGVSSLMALAEGVVDTVDTVAAVCAAIDARMGQVYWARLARDPNEAALWRWCELPRVSGPEAVPVLAVGEIGVGSGWDRYAEVLAGGVAAQWLPECFPRARQVAVIARRLLDSGTTGAWQAAMPVYVRDQVTG